MLHKAWNSKGELPYLLPRSSIKFQGHMVQNITDFDPNWAFLDYRPVAAFKSLRFALLLLNSQEVQQLPDARKLPIFLCIQYCLCWVLIFLRIVYSVKFCLHQGCTKWRTRRTSPPQADFDRAKKWFQNQAAQTFSPARLINKWNNTYL